ncbi:MAG: helix-turn-helix domain-containing protein [Kibdelosporangium sp.]
MVAGQQGCGPDPRRVHRLAGLARELDLLRARAAAGTLKAKVSLEVLTRLVRLPRSTLHRYVTGQTLAPAEVLDRIVVALGADPAEQREWSEAWYRVHGSEARHVPEPAAVSSALPACIRGFTGRAAELAELDRLLDTVTVDEAGSGLAILAVSGPPGVGKTALAVRWAHQVRGRFPDGCLYVDLRGYAPDHPLDAAESLATLLGCLGADVPDDPAVRGARYRSQLAGRRMLVLLDNALCAEQVRPLLPGTGSCVVLVTSRDDLAGLVAREGAHRMCLDVLSMPDALTLLRILLNVDRLQADPLAAVLLAERCGRLPLALRVAAEATAAHPETALAELAERPTTGLDWLAAGGDPRTDVRAVFSWSYRRLAAGDPDAASMFRLLGRHSCGDLAGVAALSGTADHRARRLVDTLARAHLVKTSLGRYQMHGLLRAYATELAAEADGMGRGSTPHPV